MVPPRSSSQRGRRSIENHRNPHAWDDERDKHIMAATFPIHPLSFMQAPFEESMLDATGGTGYVSFEDPKKTVKQRQQQLCREEDAQELEWNFTYACHWRHYPKSRFHPLLKTITQVVFGVHLLHQHLEKSVADVADILLKHVNEIDGFLQRANEDLESSLKDMLFRHKCLKVPMEHVNEFDRLLEDRAYRVQLLDGNVTIERTIARMSQMLNDYLTDISIIRDANHELDCYLLDIGEEWTFHNEDVGKIYSAMCGNTSGWAQFLQSLLVKAERLGVVLVQVSSYCNEIEKRCGAASRRSLVRSFAAMATILTSNPRGQVLTILQVATRSSSRNSSSSRDHGFGKFPQNKDLPPVPSDRPFLLSSSNTSGTATPSEVDIPQRRHQARPTRLEQTYTASSSTSAGTPKLSEESAPSSKSPEPEINRRQESKAQPEYYQETWHKEEKRGRAGMQAESGRSSRMFGHKRNLSNKSAGEAQALQTAYPINRLSTKLERDEQSPISTGKDSAYSSICEPSMTSPTVVPSRPAPSPATPQFGLFPSSARSTPKGSMNGRYGAISPVPSQSVRSTAPSSRPDTAISNVSDAPSKRLSKRSSFTSLKRLFKKKPSGDISAIPE